MLVCAGNTSPRELHPATMQLVGAVWRDFVPIARNARRGGLLGWRLRYPLQQSPNETHGVSAHRPNDDDKLDDVDTAFAPFVLGDKRLRLMEPLRQVLLGKPSFLARGN